ncbi:transcriptional regulator [Phycicoccus sp. DTK01]|nr:transcriptional regulator [Phycicoccus sp. DTK01]
MLTYAFVKTNAWDAWTLLGDPSRRAIIERLSAGSCTVKQIASTMPISRPAVSQHLKVLRDAGVVHDAPSGRTRVYSIDAARLERYRRELDHFWAGALGTLAPPATQEKGAG